MEAVAIQQLTYREFREMEFNDNDTFWYELLDGEIMKKQTPTSWHQRLSGNLYTTFTSCSEFGFALHRAAAAATDRPMHVMTHSG